MRLKRCFLCIAIIGIITYMISKYFLTDDVKLITEIMLGNNPFSGEINGLKVGQNNVKMGCDLCQVGHIYIGILKN